MLKIYNTLNRKIEDFKPIKDKQVGVYTCGPTVYSYVTIGNFRTYTLGDIVVRTLKYLGYDVKYIMNITDVGHLTGDNLGDADIGEDRLEKASKKEGKTAWEIAKFYTKDFLAGFDKLNFLRPEKFPKPTEHIQEQIDLIRKLEQKGFAYKISDGIYFDTKTYEKAGFTYGELSTLDQIKEGARVTPNLEKRDPKDFALWKFSPKKEKRHMEWDSPWGVGFPGWHIECSAMGMKYLGEQFDIHIGGEDLKSTHHPNEIAQSQAATGKVPFVKYWIHGAFLLVDGGRMGKSLGNAYTLHDIMKKDYDPMHLRYFYLTGHYRKQLNFTWEALDAARVAYEKIIDKIKEYKKYQQEGSKIESYHSENRSLIDQNRFVAALEDDFNMPKALSILWELIKSDENKGRKYKMILEFDRVFGLKLAERSREELKLTSEVKRLLNARLKARENKDWKQSDEIRIKLKKEYNIEVSDTEKGQEIKGS